MSDPSQSTKGRMLSGILSDLKATFKKLEQSIGLGHDTNSILDQAAQKVQSAISNVEQHPVIQQNPATPQAQDQSDANNLAAAKVAGAMGQKPAE